MNYVSGSGSHTHTTTLYATSNSRTSRNQYIQCLECCVCEMSTNAAIVQHKYELGPSQRQTEGAEETHTHTKKSFSSQMQFKNTFLPFIFKSINYIQFAQCVVRTYTDKLKTAVEQCQRTLQNDTKPNKTTNCVRG